ncbi:MAG: TetR/AcrR family transcriptional regulator [Rickettsiales bacterium]|jgi:TetR/AcrR family transcriptional repressor of nem operon
MNAQNKKERLIDSAAILFHRNGLMATSLADIAKDAQIPIGNVYYYFKTKDDLALAATHKRKDQFAATYMLFSENIADPRARLIEVINYYNKAGEEYTKYGCPIGKIINDTDTVKDPIAQTAALVFADFIAWAGVQFEQLGHKQDAIKYATSLMAGIQGAVIMAKTFQNPQIITDETAKLIEWIESIPNLKIQLGKAGFRSSS